MKRRSLMSLSAAAAISAIALVVWLASLGDAPKTNWATDHNKTSPSSEPALVSQTAATQAPAGPTHLPGTTLTEQGHDFDADMKSKLRSIAEAYQEQVQYPDFSQPIEPEALAARYLPQAPVTLGMPADLRDPSSPELALQADKVRYFAGDAPAATASIHGLNPEETSRVSGELRMGERVLAYASVHAHADEAHRYRLDFGRLSLPEISWKQEVFMVVAFEFRGQSHTRSLPVSIVETLARVDSVGSAQVNAEYLEIPVYVSTNKPGYHRLKGNLYDAATNQPLVHLKAQDNLTEASGVVMLKAHIAALQASGSEGPYELRDLSLQRMPSAPDFITEYGDAEDMRFTVDGFPFSAYKQTPYTHEKAQRIAQELMQLGS